MPCARACALWLAHPTPTQAAFCCCSYMADSGGEPIVRRSNPGVVYLQARMGRLEEDVGRVAAIVNGAVPAPNNWAHVWATINQLPGSAAYRELERQVEIMRVINEAYGRRILMLERLLRGAPPPPPPPPPRMPINSLLHSWVTFSHHPAAQDEDEWAGWE